MNKMGKISASVLAFEKKLVPSDGLLFGTEWNQRNIDCEKLLVNEKTVRGTISHRLKKNMRSDPAKLDAEIEKANIQTIDTCTLGIGQDTIRLNFTLKVLSGVEHPSACNNPEYYKIYNEIVNEYIKKFGFQELASRYARNIENARFLWRNRVGAEKIEVRVNVLNEHLAPHNWIFDSSSMDIRNFKEPNDDAHNQLTELIAQTLSGANKYLLLEVEAFAKVGKSQEVYPSEELVRKSSNSDVTKSKFLYKVNDQAALHSQKIGNALRTIDTWYTSESQVNPIAIDPYGAVTNLGVAYRNPKKTGLDFFSLLDTYIDQRDLDSEEQKHYTMAVLLRGGVFGEASASES